LITRSTTKPTRMPGVLWNRSPFQWCRRHRRRPQGTCWGITT
jgi:hypothetical protein